MSRNMVRGIDYTSRDYYALKQDAIKHLQEKIPEYTDVSETDAGIVLLECLCIGVDMSNFYLDNEANETMLYTCEQRRNALMWCELFGYIPRPTSPARVMVVFGLYSPNNSFDTVIPKGTVVKTSPTEREKSIMFTTEADLVIPAGKDGLEKDEEGNYLYQVSAIHGVQINKEVLGTSTGAKNQEFTLAYYPVVTDSLVVEVLEGENNWVQWTKVDFFGDSNYLDRHYRLFINDDNTATILFGDGNNGAIPPMYSSGIRVSYINGGGSEANISAGKISLMQSSNSLVSTVLNPAEVYEKGLDKESLASIKVNAPAYNRVKWGCLREADFEDVMRLLFPDILYVRAQKHPTRIDDMNIWVMLYDGKELSAERIAEMTEIMDDRKCVGTDKIYIQNMLELHTSMACELIVHDNYKRESVKKLVEDYIKDYFAVGQFDISEDVSITDLEASVFSNISGVRSFRVTTPSGLLIEVPDGMVITISDLTVNATGGED